MHVFVNTMKFRNYDCHICMLQIVNFVNKKYLNYYFNFQYFNIGTMVFKPNGVFDAGLFVIYGVFNVYHIVSIGILKIIKFFANSPFGQW